MSIKDDFLNVFNEMEKFLRIEYQDGKFNESSFMGTLYKVRGKKMNDLISNKDNFEILSQAAQLRNILVHNEDIAIPTEEFFKKFRHTVAKIIHPKTVFEVMNPIGRAVTANLYNTIDEILKLIEEKGHSNIPIVENHLLKGVFTKKTLYYYMMVKPNHVISSKMTMKDILVAMDLDHDPASYFDFIPRDMNLYDALAYFSADAKKEKELELLFVTEHGLPDEKILGLVTLWDLDQAFIEQETNE